MTSLFLELLYIRRKKEEREREEEKKNPAHLAGFGSLSSLNLSVADSCKAVVLPQNSYASGEAGRRKDHMKKVKHFVFWPVVCDLMVRRKRIQRTCRGQNCFPTSGIQP